VEYGTLFAALLMQLSNLPLLLYSVHAQPLLCSTYASHTVGGQDPDWRNALARHLSGNGDAKLAYFSDERGVVIYDAFPKGRVHMLVMPRAKELQVGAVWELSPKLLPQLQQFHSLAAAVATHLRATNAAEGAQVI
jgi:Scavenger mRNA decapping enzyme C-term binding